MLTSFVLTSFGWRCRPNLSTPRQPFRTHGASKPARPADQFRGRRSRPASTWIKAGTTDHGRRAGEIRALADGRRPARTEPAGWPPLSTTRTRSARAMPRALPGDRDLVVSSAHISRRISASGTKPPVGLLHLASRPLRGLCGALGAGTALTVGDAHLTGQRAVG